MEYPSKRQKISRIDLRQRRAFQPKAIVKKDVHKELKRTSVDEDSPLSTKDFEESLLIREMKGREAMGHKHQLLHHRQSPEIRAEMTVIVDVIATVDASGSLINIQTVPTVPSVPAVPPFPSDLTVPAVPQVTSVAFPSVPAYPFPSGVPGQSVQGMGTTSQAILSNSASTSGVPNSSLIPSSLFPTLPSTLGRNSTTSNSASFPSLSFSRNSTISSTSLQPSLSGLRSTSVSASIHSFSSSKSSPTSETPFPTSTAAGGGVGGGGGGGTAPAPTATQTAAAGNGVGGGSDDDSSITTPQVVGSVLGSLAGLAIILVIALLLLRRYKRKRRGELQLTENDTTDTRQIAGAGQPMAQRSSFVPTGAASLLSRFSASSKGTAVAGQERGFQRISGRKLPSAFSEGMTSEQFEKDRPTLSGSSFYRDSQGFYGGPGVAAAAAAGESSRAGLEKEKLMPSPARTPVIHHPDEVPPPRDGPPPGGSSLSPPGTPHQPPRGTLGRSHPSQDGSRGSRFTEDV